MKRVILLSVSILLISLGYSFAEVPCKINYQGRLIKDNVPVDGTKKMVFSIYNNAVAVTPPLWTSGEVDVTVHNGLFRYVLDLSSIDWTAGETLYLEVKVEDDILTPREELYAYPYAINSHLLEGKTTDYFLDTSGDTQIKQGDLSIMGNVGIGTASPTEKLDVDGAIRLGDTTNTNPGTIRWTGADFEGYDGTTWRRLGGIPVGTIVPYASAGAIPVGYLECNGSEASRPIYARLFAVIGTTYGAGNGSTTFNLPDLRGRFAFGSSGSHALASTGGAETHTLTVSELPSHRHHSGAYIERSAWGSNTMHYGGINVGSAVRTGSGGGVSRMPYTNYVGGGAAHNNMPPYLTIRYIIKTD